MTHISASIEAAQRARIERLKPEDSAPGAGAYLRRLCRPAACIRLALRWLCRAFCEPPAYAAQKAPQGALPPGIFVGRRPTPRRGFAPDPTKGAQAPLESRNKERFYKMGKDGLLTFTAHLTTTCQPKCRQNTKHQHASTCPAPAMQRR